jgi:hypothetical protein
MTFFKTKDQSSLSQAALETKGPLENESHSSSRLELISTLVWCLVFLRNFMAGISVLIPATALALILAATVARDIAEHRRWRKVHLLRSYRREFRRGEGVLIDGELLRYDTMLCTYEATVGILFTDIRIRSSYYTLKRELLPSSAFLYSAVSLCAGWWSLFGPITTIASLIANVGSSRRESIAMIIDRGLFNRYLKEEVSFLIKEEKKNSSI